MTDRYLARHVIHRGCRVNLSILEIVCESGIYDVKITPFEREVHSTSYHDGTIAVCSRNCTPEEALLPENQFLSGPRPPVLIFF